MAKNVAGFTVGFRFEKETPGTFRFQESGDKADHKIGTLYIRKSALPNGAPRALTLKIDVVE
jgi:hypothetical protein